MQKCLPFFLKACFGILEVTVKGGQEQIRCFCQTFALRLKFNGETKVMHVHVLQVRNHNNILYFHTLYFPQICHFDRFHSKGRKGSQKSIKLKTMPAVIGPCQHQPKQMSLLIKSLPSCFLIVCKIFSLEGLLALAPPYLLFALDLESEWPPFQSS